MTAKPKAPAVEGSDKPDTKRSSARIVQVGEEIGQRIDNYLFRILKDVPKSRIYKMIRKGEVRVNRGRVKPTYRLQAQDQVRIPPHHSRAPGERVVPDSHRLELLESMILHEDQDLLVLNKPTGLAVHGGSGISFGAIEGLRLLRPDRQLELVHRLDRDTSGCLVVAKRRPILRALHEHLRAGRVSKRYSLITHGRWPDKLNRVELPLLKYVTASGERRVRVDQAGKASRTDFVVLDRAPAASLLKADLHTGRTHQIRVHARGSSHTVIGDQKYASDAELAFAAGLGIRRLCLHAGYFAFPQAEGLAIFECPIPADFEKAWQRLQKQTRGSGPA
jgi:23S rRNA pseudouridine955/2504/2580 synthase